MGTHLTNFSRGGVARPAASTSIAGASALDATRFKAATVYGWQDLPSSLRSLDHGRGELVTEAVDNVDGAARRINGVPHQMRWGFRAYTDRLIVAHAKRALQAGGDGRLRPLGNWDKHQGYVHVPTSPPTRTRGLVDTRLATGSDDDAQREDVPALHRQAAVDLSFLPTSVQGTIRRAVPDPHTWLSLTLMWRDRNGRQDRQHVAMLRASDSAAVVIDARRKAPVGVDPLSMTDEEADHKFVRLPWTVTQLVYTFAPTRTALEGR